MNLSYKSFFQPVKMVRITGIADGVSLLLLLGVAMPLKYMAGIPLAVTIVGSVHGGIFMAYLTAVVYAQLRVQWHILWSLLCLVAAFVPFGNFVLDRYLKRHEAAFAVKPIPKTWLLYAIILFAFLDLFTQLPVMSTFAASLGASAAVAGFVVGMYSLSNLFGNIFSGILTDKYGAGAVLRAGLVTTSLALFSYGLVENAASLVLVRFLHGFLAGLIVPAAFAYLANQMKREKQGSQSAITGSFVGIAAIAGPAYSGIMAARTSVPFVFATIAVLGIALFAGALIFLGAKSEGKAAGEKRRGKLAFHRGLLQAFAGAFFLMFSQGALAYLLPLHIAGLGFSSRLSGTLMSMFGLVAVVLFVLPTNRLFDKVPPLASLATGLGLMGLSQILLGQSGGIAALYLVMAMYGLGFAALFPAVNTLLIRATNPGNRGQAYGYFYALFSAGVVVGSSGIGLLPFATAHQFLVVGLVILVSVLCVLLLAKRPAPPSG